MSHENSNVRRRWQLYLLMITVAGGMILGRILSVELVYEPSVHRKAGEPRKEGRTWPTERPLPMPTFSSNDRSRWATVRALVDHNTFVIGQRDWTVVQASVPAALAAQDPFQLTVLLEAGAHARTNSDRGIVFEDGYKTVDKMMNPRTGEFYSTKPPLLPVLMAGEYKVLQELFGWTLADDRWLVVRTMLILTNALPWILALLLFARLIEDLGTTDWGRFYMMAGICFATFNTTFLISINNHTVATCSTIFTLYFLFRIFQKGNSWWAFLLTGLCAGFTACNEFPAAAFVVGAGVLLLSCSVRHTVLFYLPAVLLLVAVLLGLNVLSLGDWKPAYSKFGGPWYQYEGSHWLPPPPGQVKFGIDFASEHEGKATYAFHLLLGHHGVFSLTPIYLFAIVGMILGAVGLFHGTKGGYKENHTIEENKTTAFWNELAFLTLGLTVVVVGFYLIQSDNYGGWTSGPRWLLWLAPLWLASMIPVVDWLGRRSWGQVLALVLLAVSVLSISYPFRNPWRHPWIYNWMDAADQIPY